MNCLNCNIEIDVNRKFCSKSCAAKYNNSHRSKKLLKQIAKNISRTKSGKIIGKRKTYIKYTCKNDKCKNIIECQPSQINHKKFCCKECRIEYKKRNWVEFHNIMKNAQKHRLGKTYDEQYGEKKSIDIKNKIRKKYIKNNNIYPWYNKDACRIIDKYGSENNYSFQHALNKGEYFISELGYWVDGYDKNKNVVIEYYERHHYFYNQKLRPKELQREKEIINYLDCKFIRINAFNPNNLVFEETI